MYRSTPTRRKRKRGSNMYCNWGANLFYTHTTPNFVHTHRITHSYSHSKPHSYSQSSSSRISISDSQTDGSYSTIFCLITVDFDDKVTVEEVENTADALANSVCQALETSIGIESFKSPCVLKSSETETKE
eukprot:UN23890